MTARPGNVVVRFLQAIDGHPPREVAAIPEAEASKYVGEGIAEYLRKPAPAPAPAAKPAETRAAAAPASTRAQTPPARKAAPAAKPAKPAPRRAKK